jgi:hypothetical protein
MRSLATLRPGCRAAMRILGDDDIATTLSDDGGPVCPWCGQAMRPVRGHPGYAKCANGDCIAYEAPFTTSVEAVDRIEVTTAPELEASDDDD